MAVVLPGLLGHDAYRKMIQRAKSNVLLKSECNASVLPCSCVKISLSFMDEPLQNVTLLRGPLGFVGTFHFVFYFSGDFSILSSEDFILDVPSYILQATGSSLSVTLKKV